MTMENWNWNKANTHFVALYDRQNVVGLKEKAKRHPIPYQGLHDVTLAAKDVYYRCATSCQTRDSLLDALQSMHDHPPSDKIAAFSFQTYLDAYLNTINELIKEYTVGQSGQ